MACPRYSLILTQSLLIAGEMFCYLMPNNNNQPFIIIENKMLLLHGYHANPCSEQLLGLKANKGEKECLCPLRGHWCWVSPCQHRTLCLSHYNIAIVGNRDDKAERFIKGSQMDVFVFLCSLHCLCVFTFAHTDSGLSIFPRFFSEVFQTTDGK